MALWINRRWTSRKFQNFTFEKSIIISQKEINRLKGRIVKKKSWIERINQTTDKWAQWIALKKGSIYNKSKRSIIKQNESSIKTGWSNEGWPRISFQELTAPIHQLFRFICICIGLIIILLIRQLMKYITP